MTPSTQDARTTGLVELAVRCEQATGADRELDAAIYAALDIQPDRHDACYPAYAYTASLDAAVKLVPEGRWWSVDAGNRADVWASGHIDERWHATAATPALALTAASLRALAASTKDMNHDG